MEISDLIVLAPIFQIKHTLKAWTKQASETILFSYNWYQNYEAKLSNMTATSHMWLFNFKLIKMKMKNPVP